jgi:predicted RNA binding protein YcfA (HicA-like mRNA interferase family)
MTEVPRGLSARTLVKALRSDRFRLMRTRGSHHIYRHPDGRRVVVGYHRMGDTFPLGTLKAMIADIGWSEDDLRRLGLVKE